MTGAVIVFVWFLAIAGFLVALSRWAKDWGKHYPVFRCKFCKGNATHTVFCYTDAGGKDVYAPVCDTHGKLAVKDRHKLFPLKKEG